jgi:hypothetical protein
MTSERTAEKVYKEIHLRSKIRREDSMDTICTDRENMQGKCS